MATNNIFTDDILKSSAREVQIREVNNLRREMETVEKHIFSEYFNLKMQRLLRRYQRPYFKFINTMGKRVAIIITVTFISLSTMAMSVEAIRVPIIHFFIEIFEEYSAVNIKSADEQQSIPTEIEKYYMPTYIPDGYQLTESTNNQSESQIITSNVYTNQKKYEIIFEQYTISTGTTANTEGTEFENIKINDYDALFFSNLGINTIIWSDEEYSFSISGKIDKKELIIMCESLKLQ